jgi:hypothetical protein
MVNTLEEGSNGLVSLDYSDLLSKILTTLQNQSPQDLFQLNERLTINIDEIAFAVAASQIENPLGAAGSSARSASVNFTKASRDTFVRQVQQIKKALEKSLEAILQHTSIEDFITSFVTDLRKFEGNTNTLGFTYSFKQQYQGLQKQRLSLQKVSGSSPILKFHKLTITVENTHEFDLQLKTSLQNFINIQFADEDESDCEELADILSDLVAKPKSDFYHLKRLMDTEALGKLQKEAKIRYLEFLKENLGNTPNGIYLEDLIRRLKLINNFINNPDKEDGYYEVNYAGISVNYRELFSRADAFDMLPIIPIIVGYLGETTDEVQGKQQFVFGLKLKFDGRIQSQDSKTVFEYNLNLLDAGSPQHQEGIADSRNKFFIEKILKVALLYFFIFASTDPSTEGYTSKSDIEYDPITKFEKNVLPVLQNSNEIEKQKCLGGIKRGLEKYNVKEKVLKLKTVLKTLLHRKQIFPTRTYPIHLSVQQGILERDIETIFKRGSFFKSVLQENPKQALKYIAVNDSNVDTTSLSTLSASINISDIHYFPTTDSQSFSMEYDITNVKTIPVVLAPQDKICQNILNVNFKQQKLLEFTYNHQRLRRQIFHNIESPQAFVYRFTFSLLAFTCLKVLLDSYKGKLFIPILRLHLTDKQDSSQEEEFMLSLFAVLSHLLNEEHRSNSQGFCIKSMNPFKVRNALSSLYSVLPKKFKFTDASSFQLDKLAIIVVSSRESDRSWKSDYKITNLLGEIIGVERQSDNSVRLYKFTNFTDNYNSQNIYSEPTVLIDQVSTLYSKGYKHFLYIAKSPYSNTLNMTRSEDDEKLFFMSKTLINSLKGNREDIKIYPIFFDQYYVVNLETLKSSSLYIQDISELTNLVEDPSKKAVVFFNLFNGITVRSQDHYYNGVISYATLLNIYENILDDKDIRMGLMYDNPLKNDILQYLTLFHFSQYEAAPRKDRNISLKLNPYQNIIGDYSVGALSITNQMTGKAKFNLLAFLTEVKKALNVQSKKN